MAHITIEYMILIPVLIAQIFIFPFAASAIMTTWTDQHRSLVLQEITGHLSSSVQQLYFTMNRASESGGRLISTLDTPRTIDDHNYTITLHDVSNPSSLAKVMKITLRLEGGNGESSSSLITLGNNAVWQNGVTYISFNVKSIAATESSGSIRLTFEGGTS
jgi:hypothetical protein